MAARVCRYCQWHPGPVRKKFNLEAVLGGLFANVLLQKKASCHHQWRQSFFFHFFRFKLPPVIKPEKMFLCLKEF
jgi:hypothetical protein